MTSFEIVRKNDRRWFSVQPPKVMRRRCPSCRFKGQPVRMRVWFERAQYSWRCPCCAFSLPIDADALARWIAKSTAPV